MKSGQGGHSACRVARTEGRPAALRASSLPNRTAGTFATFAAAVSGSPLAGRVATAGAQRPVLFRPPPPSPPPLSFRPI
jgi:hypothetical protein